MGRITKNLSCFALVCLALCLAVVVISGVRKMNVRVAEVNAELAEKTPKDTMESFRTLRQQMRAMEKAQLNDVAHGADTDSELRAMAQRQLLEICEREEKEMTLEGILEMRGFQSPVVTVHTDSVNVMILAETITQQESAVILELACRQTGVKSGNVKIIPIN